MTVLFDNKIEANLSDAQKATWKKWLELGLPVRKQERWKYTPLTHIKNILIHPLSDVVNTNAIDGLIEHDYHQVAFQNGLYRQDMSQLPEGVSVIKTSVAVNEGERESFKLLSETLCKHQWHLKVEKNKVVEKPIVIVNVISDENTNSYLSLLLDVAQSSEVKFIHYPLQINSGKALLSESIQMKLSENAKVNYLQFSPVSEDLTKITMLNVSQEKASNFKHEHIDFASQLSRMELDVFLNGEGAETDLKGIYYGHKEMHIDNYIRVYHNASYTVSAQNYKGIATQKSITVFNGAIEVGHGIQGIEASQSNPNILLSQQATMNTKPELIIYSDDVKCSHGATVGELDEKSLFYLRSRGIPFEEARKMLIHAFLDEILFELPEDNFTKRMHQTLDELGHD